MKITPHYRSCTLQINARGIPVQTGEPVKIHAFYEKDSDYIVKLIDDIASGDKAIYARMTVNETSYPDGKTLENIGGFLLLIKGHYYAALSDNEAFDTARIKMWEEPASAVEAETINIPDAAPIREAESPVAGKDNVSLTDTEPADNDVYMTQAPPVETDIFFTDTEPAGNCVYMAQIPPVETDVSYTDTEPDDNNLYMRPSEIEAVNLNEQEAHEKVRKIQRCDLSNLPRRCWNLANNSFLMHGYHNYNHLLLVEEDGHFWLGVPGIYAAREAKAAELFGFPQFTQTYINQLDLAEDECNPIERFGHWCRFIK